MLSKNYFRLFTVVCQMSQEENRSVSIGLAATSGMVWRLLRGAIEQQNDAGLFGETTPAGKK
jgi:hypothetical protein